MFSFRQTYSVTMPKEEKKIHRLSRKDQRKACLHRRDYPKNDYLLNRVAYIRLMYLLVSRTVEEKP